jgi:hypothetical protein
MPTRRPLVVLAAAAVLMSGCTTMNDRFHVPDRDPVLAFLGAEYGATTRLWPPATLPYLPPTRTELIPDRQSPPMVWADYWPYGSWWNIDAPSAWPPL